MFKTSTLIKIKYHHQTNTTTHSLLALYQLGYVNNELKRKQTSLVLFKVV